MEPKARKTARFFLAYVALECALVAGLLFVARLPLISVILGVVAVHVVAIIALVIATGQLAAGRRKPAVERARSDIRAAAPGR